MTSLDRFDGMPFLDVLEAMRSEEWSWVAKRLAGNDTGLTGGHQAGLYLPRSFFELAVPQIVTTETKNPDALLDCLQLPDGTRGKVRAIYYNNRFFTDEAGRRGTRDEFRVTRWGRRSAILDEENTGAAVILFWRKGQAVTWLAANEHEEELLQDFVGAEIEPGQFLFSSRLVPEGIGAILPAISDLIRPEWLTQFPGSRDLAQAVISAICPVGRSSDEVLMARRNLETMLFYELERRHVEPVLAAGFATIEDFITAANSITNRRKARSGRSLELHLAAVFAQNELAFEEQAVTELRKQPDFIFPSGVAYHSAASDVKLFMLAAKTCCKDRWRQVVSEAARIPDKHLFTLQEGVSENQIREMLHEKVRLVIPEQNMAKFPATIRHELLTLQQFIALVKESQEI